MNNARATLRIRVQQATYFEHILSKAVLTQSIISHIIQLLLELSRTSRERPIEVRPVPGEQF
jgi:hypothetical protein